MAKAKVTVENSLEDILGSEELAAIRETDAILRKIVTEQDGVANAKQLAYFSRQGWEISPHKYRQGPLDSTRFLRDEIARMTRVVKAELIAGTKQQRKQVAELVAKAASELKARGVEIQQQIDALSAELNGLQEAATASQRRLEECNTAAQRLREFVPPEIAQAAEACKRISKMDSKFHELESEYRSCCQLSEGLDSDCFRVAGRTPEQWQEMREKARQKLPKLTEKYEAAKIEHDKLLEQASGPLDYYLV
jgi:DNA repair exonuclease SbcCD ATPase subunit